MNEPFEFLDAEEENDDDGGFLWIPIAAGGLITVALLTIPLLGLLKSDKEAEKWADFTEPEETTIEVNLDSTDEEDDLDTYYSSKIDADLETLETYKGLQVDAALSNLSAPSSPVVAPASKPEEKQIRRVVSLKQPEVKTVSGKVTREVAVKPGDTLYRLAKENDSSPDVIAETNGINKEDPIMVGQVLKIPVALEEEPTDSVANRRVVRPAAPIGSPSKPIKYEPLKPVSSRPREVSPTPTRAPIPAPTRRTAQPVQPIVVAPKPPSSPAQAPTLFPVIAPKPVAPAPEIKNNPLDKYNTAIAYRVQGFDNLSRIADAHATSPEELIELNGRSNVKKGEMLIVPVDNCLIKNKK